MELSCMCLCMLKGRLTPPQICVRREHLFFCYKEKAALLVFSSMPFPSFLLHGALHHRPWPTVYRPHTPTGGVIAGKSRNPEQS